MAGRPDIEEYVSAPAITDIFYVAYRMIRDKAVVRSLINQLLKIVSSAEPDCRQIGCRIEDKYKDQKTGNSRAARESAIVYSGSPAVFVCNTMVCKKNDRLKCDIRRWNYLAVFPYLNKKTP